MDSFRGREAPFFFRILLSFSRSLFLSGIESRGVRLVRCSPGPARLHFSGYQRKRAREEAEINYSRAEREFLVELAHLLYYSFFVIHLAFQRWRPRSATAAPSPGNWNKRKNPVVFSRDAPGCSMSAGLNGYTTMSPSHDAQRYPCVMCSTMTMMIYLPCSKRVPKNFGELATHGWTRVSRGWQMLGATHRVALMDE